MTVEEKQKLAGFLDLAGDFLITGYMGEQKEYNFDEPPDPAENITLNSQNINDPNNGDSIEKIAAEIKNCHNCILANTRKNIVPGEGVLDPLVMVIGEGPGADEDTQGRPFVGRAGQLLDKMLASINLSRASNCFIANVVKCRPPNNRDPHPDEREACSHFLKRQITLLKPKFILLVGNVAAQCVLNAREPVGKLRGKFVDYKIGDMTIPLMVTYHPSALLRSEDYKRPAWEDLKLLRARIENSDRLTENN